MIKQFKNRVLNYSVDIYFNRICSSSNLCAYLLRFAYRKRIIVYCSKSLVINYFYE